MIPSLMAGVALTGELSELSTGFSGLSTLVSNAFSTITGTTVLAACFCAGLLGVGFRVIRQAKRF